MSSPVPRRGYAGKPAERRRAERRERFLAAGLELFGTAGYAAAPVERICELAGLSSRQFYAEFDNRDSLLLALYDQVNDRAQQAVADTAASELSGPIDLRRLIGRCVAAYIDVAAADPRWAEVAFTAIVGVNPAIEQHRLRRRQAWVGQLRVLADDLVQRKVIPARDYTLILTAFVGAINGLAHDWSVTHPRTLPAEAIAQTLAHLLYSAVITT